MRIVNLRILRHYFYCIQEKSHNYSRRTQFLFYFPNPFLFAYTNTNMSDNIQNNNKKRTTENEKNMDECLLNKVCESAETLKEKMIAQKKTISDYFPSSSTKLSEGNNSNIFSGEKKKKMCNEDTDVSSGSTRSDLLYRKNKEETTETKKHKMSQENGEKANCNNPTGKVRKIITWNVNSLTVRYKNKTKWQEFMNFFKEVDPDVMCLQEVRLPAMAPANAKSNSDVERIRSVVKCTDPKSQADCEIVNEILKNDFKDYNSYFSLANIKYSGQLMLIKKTVEVKSIAFNLTLESDPNIHNVEGRIIIAEFPEFFLLTTYSPNNGFEMPKFERRRLFDEELQNFVTFIKDIKKKPLIWTGDLNIAPEDIDLSHPEELRRMKKGNVPKEHIGQPGCTDFERKNFQKILNAGDLVDAYRHFENLRIQKENNTYKPKRNINDNIYTWRCPFNVGKQYNKGMRIDHYIVSKNFLNNVEKIHIQGYGVDHINFYGSDHCPVILYLKEEITK